MTPIEKILRQAAERRVFLAEIIDRQQGKDILLIVGIGEPFRKSPAPFLADPLLAEYLPLERMEQPILSAVRENIAREQLTGGILGAVEQHLVIFTAREHHRPARFVHPVLEIQDALLERRLQRGGKDPLARVHGIKADHAVHGKIGAVVPRIDIVDRAEHIRLAEILRPSAQELHKLAEYGAHIALCPQIRGGKAVEKIFPAALITGIFRRLREEAHGLERQRRPGNSDPGRKHTGNFQRIPSGRILRRDIFRDPFPIPADDAAAGARRRRGRILFGCADKLPAQRPRERNLRIGAQLRQFPGMQERPGQIK